MSRNIMPLFGGPVVLWAVISSLRTSAATLNSHIDVFHRYSFSILVSCAFF